MAAGKDAKWIFSKQVLEESPSRKDRIDPDKELSYRQQAANLIQDMGQRLSVNQLTINTAIVYMHRFYVYHSFTVFSRYAIAPTALFLAAKVEEQPKKLQHVLQICHACLHPDKPNLDTHSDAYLKQAQELVNNELVLLQTLGFEVSVDHPHTHVVKCTQLVKASRDLSQMAYFMATNSLHLSTFCLLYKPTVVAAMCIHLSCKWSNYEIPLSSDGKAYWSYMDASITEGLLDTIITEFLKILNRCPTRLRKLKNYRPSQNNSNKEKQDNKDEKQQPPPPTSQQSSSQTSGQTQPKKPQQVSQPPEPLPKEKKHAISLEEYKKAQAAKSQTKVVSSQSSQMHPLPQSAGVPTKSSSKAAPSTHRTAQIQSSSRIDPSKIMAKVEQSHNSAQMQARSRLVDPTKSMTKVTPSTHRPAQMHPKFRNPDPSKAIAKVESSSHRPVPMQQPVTSKSQTKMHPKEEEWRRRKAAENAARAKQSESKPLVKASCVDSPNGPLTLRIKLGSRTDSSKDSSSVAKIITPDSNSHSSRKRPHGDQDGHPSKHAKRSSEKHRPHHNRHGSSGDSKHHRHSHHKHPAGSGKSSSGIDEAVFQKSLSDAMSQVQQQHNADLSTPDSADLISPFHDKSQSRSNKVTSVFSPDANVADSQLMRSSSGYHSSQENDFQPVLLQNHFVQ